MIVLVTGADGVREVVANAARVEQVGLVGGQGRTLVQVVRTDGTLSRTIALLGASIELLPDDPGAR